MLYAKVVVGLPVDGPFDYIIPDRLSKRIVVGARVWVDFRFKKTVGYCVGLSHKTKLVKLKEISEVIDSGFTLPRNLLNLARKLSQYYCCSWGEAIETALPLALRKGKRLTEGASSEGKILRLKGKGRILPKQTLAVILLQSLSVEKRRAFYLEQIRETLKQNKSVIILLSDIKSCLSLKQLLEKEPLAAKISVLYRNEPKEPEEWLKIRQGFFNLVIGSRSAVFAPLANLGLIIIDEEYASVYKQEQVPHYHAREVALIRAKAEGAGVILGSAAFSLESFFLLRQEKETRVILQPDNLPCTVNLIPKKRNIVLAHLLEDAILESLAAKEKILIFLNRKGFATFASCNSCGMSLKCPKCDIALVYYFNQRLLRCNHCNFKTEPPNICPNCNSGYLKYSGLGTQKLESELARVFPQAKIGNSPQSDIFVATSSVIKTNYRFALSAVLAIDNALNRLDFRSTEKAFILLWNLLGLTQRKLIIETNIPNHHCFKALLNNDADKFYQEELSQRKQLELPPFRHLVLVKLRAKQQVKTQQAALLLFEKLKQADKAKGIEVVSVNPGQPPKLRGNYYWQVLLKGKNILRLNKFLKIHLKTFRHSGIIVTVDVDPI